MRQTIKLYVWYIQIKFYITVFFYSTKINVIEVSDFNFVYLIFDEVKITFYIYYKRILRI